MWQFCDDARPWLGRHTVFWPMGSEERLSLSNFSVKKTHRSNQMQTLQHCLVGKDLLTCWSFSATILSFLPSIWRRLGLEGASPCGRFAMPIGYVWKKVEQGPVEQVWKLLWQRPSWGALKAWPSAWRHNSGHNPTCSLRKPCLWVEVDSANDHTGADQRSISSSILCPAVASERCLEKVQESSELQYEHPSSFCRWVV